MTRPPRRPSAAASFLTSQSRRLGRKAPRKRPLELTRDPASGVEVAKYSNDGPTEEHCQHAQFKRKRIYERKPGSATGEARTVIYNVDVVENLLRKGKLDDPTKSDDWNARHRERVRDVADRFHTDFWRSKPDPLRALPLIWMPRADWSRGRTIRAIRTLFAIRTQQRRHRSA